MGDDNELRSYARSGNRGGYRGASRRSRNWRSNYRGRGRGYYNKTAQRNETSQYVGDTSGIPRVVDVPTHDQHTTSQISQWRNNTVQLVPLRSSKSPYYGWNMYLPNVKYEKDGLIDKKLMILKNYCQKWKNHNKATDIEERGSFTISAKELAEDESIQKEWPVVLNDLIGEPENVLSYLGLAMHQVLSEEIVQELTDENGDLPPTAQDYKVPQIHARIIDALPAKPMKDLKANSFNKLVTIKGTVVRVSNIKPICMKMAFQCMNCNQTLVALQPNGKYIIPTKCTSVGCRGGNFKPLRTSPFTEIHDSQTIKLQEILQETQNEGGRVPCTVECELLYDLVDSCIPGDIVTVTGVIKITNAEEGSRKKDKCMYLLYIMANSVCNCKNGSNSSLIHTTSPVGLELNLTDLYDIKALHDEGNLFRLFVNSLCPAIYGHEMVKAALVLGLVGGTQKYMNDCNRIPVRGDPHILIVGDPGLGKSQMLKACTSIAPRGVYVCGNTTTVSGLTVTLVKEGGSDFTLEAGALVLGDQGCCCIDEFDKMSSQHSALLEAMEQQTISIAKGGIVCSLPARTSILAAGNPVGGHYNKAKTVSENLKIGSALLSRFDLVFILLDRPDQELDKKLSEHVIALHGFKSLGQSSSNVPCRNKDLYSIPSFDQSGEESLIQRLKIGARNGWKPVSYSILRKYVAYARKYVHPRLSEEACQVLQAFYLELRKNHHTTEGTPITTRQLESLIRLTEARARIEFREVASKQDAIDVIEMMKISMTDTCSNGLGLLEFRRSQNGSGMSRSNAKRFIAALTTLSETTYNSLFSFQQMKEIAAGMNMKIVDFGSFIDSLNNQGFLIKKGNKVYQLQTTDF